MYLESLLRLPAIIFSLLSMGLSCLVTGTKFENIQIVNPDNSFDLAISYSFAPKYKIQKIIIAIMMFLSPVLYLAIAQTFSQPIFIALVVYGVLAYENFLPNKNLFDMSEFSTAHEQELIDELYGDA